MFNVRTQGLGYRLGAHVSFALPEAILSLHVRDAKRGRVMYCRFPAYLSHTYTVERVFSIIDP